MADSSLLYLCGQISVLETHLLGAERLEPLVTASTVDEAFQNFKDLGYGIGYSDMVKPSDFGKWLSESLLKTKNALNQSLDESLRQVFWLIFDINNLKAAFKDRFVLGKNSLESFEEESGYTALGSLSLQEIVEIVFSGKGGESLPSQTREVVSRFYAQGISEKGHFVIEDLEMELDQAFLQDFLAQVLRNDKTLEAYARRMIDVYNLRSFIRAYLLRGECLTSFVQGGNPEIREALSGKVDFNLYIALLRRQEGLEKLAMEALNLGANELSLSHLEIGLEKWLFSALDQACEQDGLGKVLRYVQRRFLETRRIKVVMFGKFYGLNPEVIRSKLTQIPTL